MRRTGPTHDVSCMKPTIALTLLAVSAASCNLVNARLPFGAGSSSTPAASQPARQASQDAPARDIPSGASSKAAPAVNADAKPNKTYEKCVATFDQNYDAWMKMSAPARKALEQARKESPHVAMATLLQAWEALDEAAAIRQSGKMPVGAIYFHTVAAELALQIFGLDDELVATRCINNQMWINYRDVPDGTSYYGKWTGKREVDLAAVCGGPTMAQFRKAEQARLDYVDHYNATVKAVLDKVRGGGMFFVKSINRTKTSDTLVLAESLNNGKCVEDGTWVNDGGRLAKGCTWVYGKNKAASETHTYHFAPAALPFAIKAGDQVNMAYEIDPDAPATSSRFRKEKDGGKWGVSSVDRNGKSVYYMCDSKKHRGLRIIGLYPGAIKWNAE